MKIRRSITSIVIIASISFFLLSSFLFAENRIGHVNDQVRNLSPSKLIPSQINYQGYLADTSDSLSITATLEMTFRLFDTETKGVELWSETHPAAEIQGGLFQVLLGSVISFPDGLFDGSQLWLQTEVGPEILVPRKPLVSVAYSQMTENADHAASADWATDAQHAVHSDTAAYSPSVSAWTVSGDDVYRETGKVGIGTSSPLTELDVTGSVNATTYYGDGSNLTGISGTTDNDWTISGNDIYSSVSGNVGIGTSSPSARLDVSGEVNTDSVYQIDGNTVLSTEGWKNVSTGIDAGVNNTGDGCTFVGYRAGQKNQSNFNTFIGSEAGDSNTAGYSNTFIGASAGQKNTEADLNTFIGVGAGYENTTGIENTFVGHWTGQQSGAGDHNTFVGASAGYYSSTASSNVYIGWQAGYSNHSGLDNVFIGSSAGSNEQGSNKLIIANDADTSSVLIYGDFSSGNVGLGTMAPAERLHLHEPSGNLGMRISSDAASYQYFNFGADKGYAFGRDPNNKFFLNAEQPLGTGTMRILTATESGNVGIGTSSPGYKLDVAGDINTTGDIRKNGGVYNHPDYVFEPEYDLMPLADLNNYLEQNRHLPGMPSAKEVEEEGIMLFEQNRLLLEKLEESYLYIVELQKKIVKLENTVQDHLNLEQ
ncbi:hypothetical protein ACFL0G_04440 [Candidatus Zixiibacteriota bacterium]